MDNLNSDKKKYETSWINEFLVYRCAGCDRNIINKSPQSVWIKYARIGTFVFLTSILAFMTSCYTIQTIFENPWISFSFGLLWALIIFNFDQYLVITTKRINNPPSLLSFILRLLLAIIIAFTISKPIEVAIFKDKIDERLKENLIKKQKEIQDSTTVKTNNINSVIKTEKSKLDTLKEKYYLEVNGKGNSELFSGKLGYGKQAQERKRDYLNDSIRFSAFEKNKLKEIGEIKKFDSTRIAEYKKSQANGFFGRYELLQELSEEKDSIFYANLLVLLLFIFVEISPILTKAFSDKDLYEEYLEAEQKKKRIKKISRQEAYEKSMGNYKTNKEESFNVKNNNLLKQKKLVIQSEFMHFIKEKIAIFNASYGSTKTAKTNDILEGKYIQAIKDSITDFFK